MQLIIKLLLIFVCVCAALLVEKSTTFPKATSTNSITEQGGKALTLPNGRIMEYFTAGNANTGEPLIIFHGPVSSGRICFTYDSYFKSQNIFAICPSLPGYGLSDLQPQQSLMTFMFPMNMLLDELKITRKFSIVGIGTSASHALLISSMMPSRIQSVGLFAPYIPHNEQKKIGLYKGHWLRSGITEFITQPYISEIISYLVKQLTVHHAHLLIRSLPSDGLKPEIEHTVKQSMNRTHLALFDPVYFAEWNPSVAPRTLSAQGNILVSCGASDPLFPPYMAQYLSQQIPNAKLVEYPNEGYSHVYTQFTDLISRMSVGDK